MASYSMRQVNTLAEAELLVEQEGYCGLQEVKSTGHMAQPTERLAVLGRLNQQLSQESNNE